MGRYRGVVPEPFAERVLHVDMDAFFVEVERLKDPRLVGLPVVVGGIGPRGVVASASYEARRFGVRSAMPTAHARRLAPGARFLPPDHSAYREASRRVFAVLEELSPVVEPLSVDEAFIDIGGLRFHHPSPHAVGVLLRERIREATGLPASAGAATSKLIAKLASEDAKPDGLLVVAAGTERAFLAPKGVRALWGVGEATFARLEGLGVRTIGELAALPAQLLERRLGASLGRLLHDLAHARDPRPVERGAAAKSISAEQTYEQDLVNREVIESELLRHADRVASRLRSAGLAGRTVVLKVRLGDFSTVTRSETTAGAVLTAHAVYEVARRLFARSGAAGRPVRLLGLAVTGLEPADGPRQLDLEGDDWEDVEGAVARVRARFGHGAVRPARLIDEPDSQNL